jgi:fatty acid desaturase
MRRRDDLEASRAEFETKVRATYARRAAPKPGGKGSPPALLVTGLIGTGSLALVAALLGGGLLYLPALIPLVTVLLVLGARVLAARREG